MYSKTERQVFDTKAKEHATKLAERNTDCFFEATDPAPFHTPSREDWQKISSLHTFDPQKQCYSMLHKYANNRSAKSKKEGQDHIASATAEEAQACSIETNLLQCSQSFNPTDRTGVLFSAHTEVYVN